MAVSTHRVVLFDAPGHAAAAAHLQSVYHMCWLRGLFPEEYFTGHDLVQMDRTYENADYIFAYGIVYGVVYGIVYI